MQIVYIDTVDAERFGRALVPPEYVVKNDNMKRERGVELIRQDTDLVLSNDGVFLSIMDTLLRFVRGFENWDQNHAAVRLTSSEALGYR